jgi:hypothetical protein
MALMFVKINAHLPTVHVFHAQNDVSGFILECSIKGHNVWGVAVVSDLKLS